MKINFEHAFTKGHKSYDTKVGDWWENQAINGSHRKAYANIAEYMHAHSAKKGNREFRWIVDYACGSGIFLAALAEKFPRARIVALDGSRKMLARAQDRMTAAGHDAAPVSVRASFDPKGPRIRLVQTNLPNFSLPTGRADAVAFCFPNLTAGPGDQPYFDRHGYRNREDTKVAKVLARLREMDPEDEVVKDDPETLFDGLMTERVIARSIRHLLRKNGAWFKVDYANALREHLSGLTQKRSLFSEGALEEPVKDMRPRVFFRYLGNQFQRSQVILDVYHQTKDPTDKTGGYFISGFEAR